MTTTTGIDGPETLRLLSDKPLNDAAVDRLQFAAYADALADLLDNPETDTPLTIAINAQWGAGKTSLAKLVERRLEQRARQRSQAPAIVCWFNAWSHDDAPHLGAAFAADVAKTADRKRPWWRRLIWPLPTAMLNPEQRWKRRLKMAGAVLLIVGASALFPGPRRALQQAFAPNNDVLDVLRELFGSSHVGAAVLLLVLFAFWRKVFAIAQSAARFIDDPRSEAAKGSIEDVSTQLRQLIEQSTHVRRRWLIVPRDPRRFIIFVDDLERCRPPRAVEVCEVASQLLGHPNVITVLIADMTSIAKSAEIKYSKHLGDGDSRASTLPLPSGSYGRLYLQKIVQIQFNLPPSPPGSMSELLTKEETVPAQRPKRRRIFRNKLAGRMAAYLSFIALFYIGTSWWRAKSSGKSYIAQWRDSWSDPWSGLWPDPLWGKILIIFLAVVYLIGIVGGMFAFIFTLTDDFREFRTRQAQNQIDRAVREQVNKGSATVDEIIDALNRPQDDPDADDYKLPVTTSRTTRTLRRLTGLTDKQDFDPKFYRRYEDLARQRAQRILADHVSTRVQAENLNKDYLPPLPRASKRLFNHFRVLTILAEKKRMLGGDPTLDYSHIAKWAVILERWPELASALTVDPSKLVSLESAASPDGLSDLIRPMVPDWTASQDLLPFLTSPPMLGPVAERLIYFQSSTSEESSETKPEDGSTSEESSETKPKDAVVITFSSS